MKIFNFFSSVGSLVGVLVLTAGIVFGVTLVKQEQDIRNKAAEVKEHKVEVCHKTGSESNSWVQIEVSENALESHLSHGDIQGNCPSTGGQDDKDKGKNDDKGNSGQGGNSASPVSLANNVTVNNQTVAASEVRVETKYVYVTSQFDFYITFQGIDTKRDNKIIRIIFRKGVEELHVYNKVEVTADAKGVYRGVIKDVRPGTYDVLVKGNGFLQRKFEEITLKNGKNTFDWRESELLAGDFNADNQLDAKDVAQFLSFYNQELTPVSEETGDFDINLDKQIDLDDLSNVLENYKNLIVYGEE